MIDVGLLAPAVAAVAAAIFAILFSRRLRDRAYRAAAEAKLKAQPAAE